MYIPIRQPSITRVTINANIDPPELCTSGFSGCMLKSRIHHLLYQNQLIWNLSLGGNVS
jgi:hypothetical protein